MNASITSLLGEFYKASERLYSVRSRDGAMEFIGDYYALLDWLESLPTLRGVEIVPH